MFSTNRRKILQMMGAGGAASAMLTAGCSTRTPKFQGAKPQVVIVGGGFGGATCAKYLRRLDPDIEVTLIEYNPRYTTCPGSNWVLGGYRNMEDITHDYDTLERRYGIKRINAWVGQINATSKEVVLADGTVINYDHLVVAPGIDFRWDYVEGYDEAATELMPHAWKAGPQTVNLHNQLRTMKDGGTVIICPPPMPFRCPPGPPERASMVAHYLKRFKPRSKVLILDAKEKFSKQGLFMAAWKDLYGDMIEFVPASQGGLVSRVDPRTRTVYTEDGFTAHKGDVVNFIPAQKAGNIAHHAGLTNESGWCPVHQDTFESTIHRDIHVIGDSAVAGVLPKSGHTANNIAKMTAAAIVAHFRELDLPVPSHVNTCYSLVSPDYGISIAAVYRLEGGQLVGVPGAGGLSPAQAPAEFRRQEARYATGWYDNITADSFT